jgi:hemin uptake protein HemP
MLNPTLRLNHPSTRALAMQPTKQQPNTPTAAAPAPAPVPSAALLQGHKTVAIAHNGMLYTLQATKLGKLILTK